jgi:hypothetical protein
METIITTVRALEYVDSLLNYKAKGELLKHLKTAHSFYLFNPRIIQREGVNMYQYGFVDDTRPCFIETILDTFVLRDAMIQNGYDELSVDVYNKYVNLVIKAAITNLENVGIDNIQDILRISNEVFEILFGHLFNFDSEDISVGVFTGTPEIKYLRGHLLEIIETFQSSACIENKFTLFRNNLFVADGHTGQGYGVKSAKELIEIKSTYFNPQSDKYLPGAVQHNLKKIRELVERAC